jgi:DNA (cytosine-5)-methyltransferase 1
MKRNILITKDNMIKVASDFSGVGAFNQALKRLGIEYDEIFACDMDKYARQTFIHNYGEPKYYPSNVYEREIPSESLDIYMTSPPCQAFSLAGKRLGKNDKRGILFFNSLEFIEKNKPRFFIFENVKGLLSDDGGRTFSEWVNFLGGKSVNGAPVLFPYADSVPYHLYWKVLNAKHHGVPQNRERVFLIGIRDDIDNNFSFPAEEHLTKRLKDVLEQEILEKFYLSNAAIEKCLKSQANKDLCIKEVSDISKCIVAGYYKIPFDGQYIKVQSNLEKYFLSEKMVDYLSTRSDNFNNGKINYKDENDYASTITKSSSSIDISDNILKIKSATSKGYEEATDGDSINFSVLSSETRRGRVGKGVAQTLDTSCNQGVMVIAFGRSEEEKKRRKEHFKKTGLDSGSFKDKELIIKDQDYFDTLLANPNPQKEGLIFCGAIRGRGENNEQTLELNNSDYTNSITTVQKDNILTDGYKIRRLTPRECFRLMDFPDSFTWPVSDSQAYKQAGNSIVVNVLYKILKNLSL